MVASLALASLKSLFRLLAGVLTRPRTTLPRLAMLPTFWVPVVGLSAAFAFFRLTGLSEERTRLNSPEYQERYTHAKNLTPEKARQELEMVARAAPAVILVESPVITTLGVSAVAALMSLAGRVYFRRKLPFGTVFSLAAWASVVGAVPLLLHGTLRLTKADWSPPTNPVLLFPALSTSLDPYFRHLLEALDLFAIWQAWVLSMGMAGLYEVSPQRAAGVVGTAYVCLAVLNALVLSQPPL